MNLKYKSEISILNSFWHPVTSEGWWTSPPSYSLTYREGSRTTDKRLVSGKDSHQGQLSCICLFRCWKRKDSTNILIPPLPYSSRVVTLLGDYPLVVNPTDSYSFLICPFTCPKDLTTAPPKFLKSASLQILRDRTVILYFLLKSLEWKKNHIK